MSAAWPVYLVGYRGTGKTTVARLLADRLGVPWLDADTLLEERAGRTIREVFADEGEAGFRDRESAVLRSLPAGRCVVATGGGVVLRPENRDVLKRGTAVWLTAPPAVLWERMQADATTAARRPNLAQGGLAEVESLLAARTPHYAEVAALAFDTAAASPEPVAATIAAWLDAAGRRPG